MVFFLLILIFIYLLRDDVKFMQFKRVSAVQSIRISRSRTVRRCVERNHFILLDFPPPNSVYTSTQFTISI